MMNDLRDITYTPASGNDISEIARIYYRGFEGHILALFGKIPAPRAAEDLLRFFAALEGGGLIAAKDGERIVGFVWVTQSLSGFIRRMISRGFAFKLLLRWIFGRYEFGGRIFGSVARAIWLFLRTADRYRTAGDANILAVAVDEAYRGRGVGTELVKFALDYLRRCGAPEVRLEVRPDNAPARRVYSKLGFVEKGTLPTAIGGTIVMTKFLIP
ncbi:MAG: GNAT family N-acetyltransferase [bacterium]